MNTARTRARTRARTTARTTARTRANAYLEEKIFTVGGKEGINNTGINYVIDDNKRDDLNGCENDIIVY